MILKPSFSVNVVPKDAMIHMTFAGFWDADTATAFAIELDHAIHTLVKTDSPPSSLVYLADFRASALQSPILVARFQEFAATSGIHARRIAVITAGALQKMQVQRIATGYDHFRFFLPDEADSARKWLLEHNLGASSA